MEHKQIGIWIRVSTDYQVRDESPEHHEQRARYYAKSRDWDVVEVYRLDAISGKTVMEHPETQRMLNDIRTGRITGLVFSKLARLARNTKELLEFAEIFRKEGADLISLAEQIDTSTPAGRLFFTIISAMAQWEREEISSRVAASIPIRAQMGKPLGGQASFGYKWENKQLMIDEKEAPIRKLVYQIFLECQRIQTTADKLNQLGHRTRNGAKFSGTTVQRLLRDTSAKGIRIANYTKTTPEGGWIIKPKEEWVELECPRVIDEETWQKCNIILDKQAEKLKKPGRTSEFLLAGLIRCGCGAPMYKLSTARKFTCQKCKKFIDEQLINNTYQAHLKEYLGGMNTQIFIDELNRQIKEKEALLSSSVKKRNQHLKKMDDLVNLRLNSGIDQEHYMNLYKPLSQEVAQLKDYIPKLEGEIDYIKVQLNSSDYVLSQARALYEEWSQMEISQKRGIIETVTDYIIVEDDTIKISVSFFLDNRQTNKRGFTGSWRPPT
ncbi:recombinase family protein [Pedobacter nanyangensis]|uniref:recombinase family protein n=1 Tax=Pedobacter nanyangensis TaxID=1562389 RepID=UPI000DE4B977|nr:recombinase family protein [Pedobacter nanyangensis]